MEAVTQTVHNPAPHPSVVVDTNIPAVSVAGEARRMCILGADAWRRVVGAWRRIAGTHAKAKLEAVIEAKRTKLDSSPGRNMFVAGVAAREAGS